MRCPPRPVESRVFWVGDCINVVLCLRNHLPEIVFFLGETVLKVKVPPARIENSLLPLYSGTDFSTLVGTFQTVWGEARWVNELALKPKKAHSLKKVKTIHGFL